MPVFRLISAVCMLFAAAMTSATGAEQDRFLDGLMAVINKDVVTFYDVTRHTRMEERLQMSRVLASDVEDKEKAFLAAVREYRLGALELLINHEMIYHEFQRLQFKVPSELVDRRIDRVVASEAGGDYQKFEDMLTENRLSMDDLRERIRKNLAVDLFMHQQVDRNIRLSPARVRQHYRQNQDAYRNPAEVRVQMIMLNQDGQETDAEFLQRVEAVAASIEARKEDFAALARRFSDSPNKETADDVGWISVAGLTPEFKDALPSYRQGQTAGPVRVNQNVIFLRVADSRGGEVPTFEQVRKQVENDLHVAERRRRFDIFIADIRRKAFIRRLEF